MLEFFYNFNGYNKELFLQINHFTNINILPFILQIISWPFGISKFAIYYVFCVIYFFIILNRIDDHTEYKNKFWNIYNNMVRVGIIYSFFGLLYAFLKYNINLPRPFCSLRSEDFFTIADISKERCLSSFPSSHTGLAVIIAYFLWPYLNYGQKIFATLIIILVGVSRLALAMHYPADIIYSIFIAAIVIIVGNLFFKLFKNNLIQIIGEVIIKKLSPFKNHSH